MPDNQITKEEIKRLMEIPGKARGVVFRTDAEYVKEKKGEEGLKRVEEELKKLGQPIDYKKIKAIGWYPVGLRVASLLVIKKIFNWTNKEIEQMGDAAPKYSFIVRLLLKYFISFPITYKKSPAYWVKHYNIGELETPEYKLTKKNGYGIIRIKNFKVHPVMCTYLGGYFTRMCQMVLKGAKNFKWVENKCAHKGDSYHEFRVSWEF